MAGIFGVQYGMERLVLGFFSSFSFFLFLTQHKVIDSIFNEAAFWL